MTEDTPTTPDTELPDPVAATQMTVRQHKLSSDKPTDVDLPEGTTPLDVHMIDGEFFLRTLEPSEPDGPVHTFTLVPANLNSVIEVADDAIVSVIAVRHGGIHFLVVR